MFKNYFKTAIRNLWKNKTYSFLNIFGLAVGIACAALIFLWVEDEKNFDRTNLKRSQLYLVNENQSYEGKTYTFDVTPGPLAEGMKAEIPGIKNTARLTWSHYTLFGLGEKAIYERGYYADPSIFDMFTIILIQGKKENVFKQPKSLVISEKMAKKFFGNQVDIIGKALKVNNKDEFIISGVMKDIPENTTYKFDWLSSFQVILSKNEWLNEWGNNSIRTFVELDEQADPVSINKKLDGYILSKDTNAIARPFLHSMKDWRLHNKFEEGKISGGRIQYVKMFTVIAWIILLIACINFMNLATARSEKRAREVGVRKVLGARRPLLVSQFIGESLVMSFISVLMAVFFILLLLPWFNTIVDKHLVAGITNSTHLGVLIITGILCGLVAGSYPALYLSSFNPIGVLKGLKLKGTTPALVRKGLVVLQFTISISLIIGTIIVYRQINHVKNRDLGYDKNNLVQTGLRGDLKKNFPAIKQEMLTSGYVENVGMSSMNILYTASSTNDFRWEGKDPGKKVLITNGYVSPEYISTTAIHIKKGRDFYPDAKADSFSVIINQSLANMIGKDPVGKILMRDTAENSGVPYTNVGVMDDYVFDDMYGKSEPVVFMSQPEDFGYLYVRIKNGIDKEKAMSAITGIMKKNNPAYPFDYIFVSDEFNRVFKSENLIGKLSRIFALLAIVISCLGLFGLAAYTAERRTREIGIRKVLGATVSGITGLLSRDFLRLVLFSSFIAFPVSWWAMHKWLQNYAYRVAIDWWIFILAGLLALVIAVFTISFQSIRAAIANPVKSLRTE